MSHTWLVFIALAVLLAFFAWSAAWSRRDTNIRHILVAAFVVALPLLAVGGTEVMGWHKPYGLAWRLSDKAVVLGHKLMRGEAIYIYVDTGQGEPRAIFLPWDDAVAEELEAAKRESKRRGREGVLMNRRDDRPDREYEFRPFPAEPRSEPKQAPEAPTVYERD